jgi:hypothetical protein
MTNSAKRLGGKFQPAASCIFPLKGYSSEDFRAGNNWSQKLDSFGCPRLYCNYQQDNWVDLLPIAEFEYNNSPHSATQVSPFFANYGFNPRATVSANISVPDPAAHNFAQDLTNLHQYCKQEILAAQAQYQGPGDQRRQPPPALKVGQLVWLNAKNITTKRPSKKLDHKRLRLFPIEKIISSHAFRLKLPTGMRFLHPVFHILLLEPHNANNIPNRTQPQPPPVEIDGTSEFQVSAILDSRLVRKKVQYLVQWEGYKNIAEATSWEPPNNVQNASELVSAFLPCLQTSRGLRSTLRTFRSKLLRAETTFYNFTWLL